VRTATTASGYRAAYRVHLRRCWALLGECRLWLHWLRENGHLPWPREGEH